MQAFITHLTDLIHPSCHVYKHIYFTSKAREKITGSFLFAKIFTVSIEHKSTNLVGKKLNMLKGRIAYRHIE